MSPGHVGAEPRGPAAGRAEPEDVGGWDPLGHSGRFPAETSAAVAHGTARAGGGSSVEGASEQRLDPPCQMRAARPWAGGWERAGQPQGPPVSLFRHPPIVDDLRSTVRAPPSRTPRRREEQAPGTCAVDVTVCREGPREAGRSRDTVMAFLVTRPQIQSPRDPCRAVWQCRALTYPL